jgi:adenylyl- and sulfurtransferase ThiI
MEAKISWYNISLRPFSIVPSILETDKLKNKYEVIMKEIFLLKLGEIVLKGANKRQFEARLRQNVRRRMKTYGNFDVYLMQSTIYVEPMDDDCDIDGAWEACRSIFGVVSLCRCRPCEKNLDAIFNAVEEYLGDDLDCAKSFKVESKRSDKSFPLGSIQISQEIGGRLAEAHPSVAVDVRHPDYTVFVEVRDLAAYVHGPAEPGAGGLPTGVGGRAMCLLSGGIGVGISYLISYIASEIVMHLANVPNIATLDPKHAILLITLSVVLTLISGLIPSRSAANKDPVDALRTE